MKRIVIFLILFISITNTNYATSNDILELQKDELNISNFITEADKYTSEQFDDLNIKDLFNSAIKGEIDNSSLYKRILNIFGLELKSTINILRQHFDSNCYT